MRLARECLRVRTTTDNTVRKRSKLEFFNVGSCIISWKWRICEENMRTKTHRRKMYAAMECESVEISGLLQVRIKLWSCEIYPPQKRASIFRTLFLCTEKESYIGLVQAVLWSIFFLPPKIFLIAEIQFVLNKTSCVMFPSLLNVGGGVNLCCCICLH